MAKLYSEVTYKQHHVHRRASLVLFLLLQLLLPLPFQLAVRDHRRGRGNRSLPGRNFTLTNLHKADDDNDQSRPKAESSPILHLLVLSKNNATKEDLPSEPDAFVEWDHERSWTVLQRHVDEVYLANNE